jgi:thiol:disulfide interchange protein DsbA
MPRFISVCLTAILIFSAGSALAERKEGRGYVTLPVQNKILGAETSEAALFFWYGCGGCFRVARAISERGGDWPRDTALLRVPALANPVWTFHGQIFLALEAMGAPPEIHLAVFDAFQNKRLRVMERGDLPKLIKHLNLDGIHFMRAFDSPEVQAKMEEARRISQTYAIAMVPAMVVEGRYKFDLGAVNGPEDFIRMTEELLGLSQKPALPK